jgi:hypothetical protein
MEIELDRTIAFLDILVIGKEPAVNTKVYIKSTHIGCYLNFESNYPHEIKETENLTCDLQLNGYPSMFNDSLINKYLGRSHAVLTDTHQIKFDLCHGLDDQDSISDRGRNFLLCQCVQTNPTFYPMGTRGSFTGGKVARA